MEVRFYHLLSSGIDQALPALVAKAYQGGNKIFIRTRDERHAEQICDVLWTFRADSFLPHGTKKDGKADQQPIWIGPEEGNPNNADILIVLGGQEFNGGDEQSSGQYKMLCDMFDGRMDDDVTAARSRWKTYKEAGYDLTYWQQTPQGGWDKKA